MGSLDSGRLVKIAHFTQTYQQLSPRSRSGGPCLMRAPLPAALDRLLDELHAESDEQRSRYRTLANGEGISGQFAINRFVVETNADPKPFVRTADPKRVLAAVKRARRQAPRQASTHRLGEDAQAWWRHDDWSSPDRRAWSESMTAPLHRSDGRCR